MPLSGRFKDKMGLRQIIRYYSYLQSLFAEIPMAIKICQCLKIGIIVIFHLRKFYDFSIHCPMQTYVILGSR